MLHKPKWWVHDRGKQSASQHRLRYVALILCLVAGMLFNGCSKKPRDTSPESAAMQQNEGALEEKVAVIPVSAAEQEVLPPETVSYTHLTLPTKA